VLLNDLELVLGRLVVFCGFGLGETWDAEVVVVADVLGAPYADLQRGLARAQWQETQDRNALWT
jgi:hypothetical protein